jgi:competence protein ComGC
MDMTLYIAIPEITKEAVSFARNGIAAQLSVLNAHQT